MDYSEYIKARQMRGYNDPDAIDTRGESTEELVSAIFADGYTYDSEIETAIIIRSGLEMGYDEWEEMGEDTIFCALDKLGYKEDGMRKPQFSLRIFDMYVIELVEEEGRYYWTYQCGDTDNYTADIADATVFRSKSAAYAMADTLGKEDHIVTKVCAALDCSGD